MVQSFLTSRRNEAGATAAEYAVIVALVTVAIAGAVAGLGDKVNRIFLTTVSIFSSP